MSSANIDTLVPASYRTVKVKDVDVELFEGGWPAPVQLPLGEWAESGWYSPEEITRLHLAGVEWLPLYETEANRRGIKWEEI